MKHIDEMEYLRDKVGLMWYAQLDPLVIYKKEAFEKFQTLLWRLKSDVTTYLIGVDVELNFSSVQEKSSTSDDYMQILEDVSKIVAKTPAHSNKLQSAKSNDGIEIFEVGNEKEEESTYAHIFEETPGKKARPNDPCLCGSGKKYKKCCGA